MEEPQGVDADADAIADGASVYAGIPMAEHGSVGVATADGWPTIRRFSRQEVLAGNKTRFNVSNLHTKMPPDYHQRLNDCRTGRWVDAFHADHFRLVLKQADLDWMLRAQRASRAAGGGAFPAEFESYIRESVRRHAEVWDRVCAAGSDWFVRTEDVSMKYALHGVGPYGPTAGGLRRVLESVSSYGGGHSPLASAQKNALYFLPWLDLDPMKEFRVFVCELRVTAISQQFLFDVDEWLAAKTDADLCGIVGRICEFFESDVKPKISWMRSFVMDVALIGPDEHPYFIEPNPFGAEYASASGLFHWREDDAILRGKRPIELRFVDRA